LSNPQTPDAALKPDGRDVAVSWLAAALPGVYLLLTSTTNLVPGIWPYDAKRMLQFALLLLLFVLPALNRQISRQLGVTLAAVPGWVSWSLIAVFGWGMVSAFVNARSPMHLANSLSEVVLFASLALGVFVIAACRTVGGRVFDRIAIGLLAVTALAVGLQELLGMAAAHASGVNFNFRISLLHFSWPRFYNQVQSWAVPAITALPLLFNHSPISRVACVIALALQWYIILVTGARGSFIALSAAMIAASLLMPSVRRPLLRWQIPGLVLGTLIFAAVLISFEADTAADAQTPKSPAASGFYGNEDGSLSSFSAQSVGRPLLDPMGRTWMWKIALRDAGQHPALGIGPMNYVCTRPEYIGHPHNFPLQLAAEWGVPVAFTVCMLFAVLMGYAVRRVRRSATEPANDSAVSGLMLIGIFAAALHACVSGVIVMPASQVSGLLIIGLFLGSTSTEKQQERARSTGFMISSGIVFCAALLTLGVHELSTLAERSAQMTPGEDMRPRMWQDAKVCRLYVPQHEVTN